VGYFQPDDCDNENTTCEFSAYPEYDNLKTAYTTTKNSTVEMASFAPSRTSALQCPSKLSMDLPATPDGTFSLELTTSAPCAGVNQFTA
jgi:hypothetical protein